MDKEEITVKSVPSGNQTAAVNTPSSPQLKGNKNPESFNNDIIIDQGRNKNQGEFWFLTE